MRLADESPIPYDMLVLATGARHAGSVTPNGPRRRPVKSLEDAKAMRGRRLLAFERAESRPTPRGSRRC